MSTGLTAEFLADYETPQSLRLSPSGSHVVYPLRSFWVRKDKQEQITASLWIAEVGKANSARQLTTGKYNDHSPQFSPDGKSIIFVSDRASVGKGSALFMMPLEGGGEGLPITDTANEKGVGEWKYSPDGKMIAFTSADENSEEKKKREEAKDDAQVWGEHWDFGRLRILDVETKEVTTVVKMEAHVASFDWSPDGKKFVFLERETPELDSGGKGGKIKVVDIASKTITQVAEIDGDFSNLLWSGGSIYAIGSSDGKGVQKSHSIWRIEADTKDTKPECVAYGTTNCAREAKRCGSEVVVYIADHLRDQLKTLDGQSIFDEEIDIDRGWDAVLAKEKTTVAVIRALDTAMPLEVFSYVNGKKCQLSNHNAKYADLKLAKTTSLLCTAGDGTSVEGLLSVPSTLEKKKGPHRAVVVVHGGPYSRILRGSDMLLNFCDWFLSLGYVVLQANYRGSAGYGEDFAKTVLGNPGASYSDNIDLLKKAVADGVVDKDKVAIAGWSQGGFMTYLAGTRDSTFHFQAAIAGAGVSDWDTMTMTSDVPYYQGTLNGKPPWMCSSASDTSGRNSSPLYHMQDIKTPFLILHGEKDQRVPLEQAVAFHRGLQARGKEVEMVVYPREGHGLPMPWERTHYIHMLKKMESFLEKHMR